MLYNKYNHVQYYFEDTRHIGRLTEPSQTIYISRAGIPENGEVIEISLAVKDLSIINAKFLAQASPTVVASCAWLTNHLIGQNVDQLGQITVQQIIQALSLPDHQYHNACLAYQAVQRLILEIEKDGDKKCLA